MIFSAIVAFMFSLAYNFGQLRIYMIVGFLLKNFNSFAKTFLKNLIIFREKVQNIE